MKSGHPSKLLIATFILLVVSACNTVAPIVTPSPVAPTATTVPTATSVVSQDLTPAPTDIQLPYNLVTESAEYCKQPSALLSVANGNDISEDEIVYKLVEIWLRRYKSPEAHPYCRIDGYTIDKVYYDPSINSQPLEPKGDFMRVVLFSVKLIQIPNDWMSLSGELDQKNWLHISQIVAISKTNDGYKMEFAYP
ncbi:MAG TPA: hypothetical protein VK206_01255 [Anaerolineales bacterium]|nr:hypothetical protein [Anaerolineales bacterium]